MVMRTIEIKEISFEVEPARVEGVVQKIRELYPALAVEVEGKVVKVSGDLHNYKRRNMLIYILSGGKHGTNIQTS